MYYIAFNNLTSGVGQPTEDPVVRQALNHAVDVEGIIGALFNGKGVRATGLMTAADFGYNSDLSPYAYDPDRARELLAQAGYSDGFDLGFACPSGAYTNFEQVCEAVAAQLAEVGVNASLDDHGLRCVLGPGVPEAASAAVRRQLVERQSRGLGSPAGCHGWKCCELSRHGRTRSSTS